MRAAEGAGGGLHACAPVERPAALAIAIATANSNSPASLYPSGHFFSGQQAAWSEPKSAAAQTVTGSATPNFLTLSSSRDAGAHLHFTCSFSFGAGPWFFARRLLADLAPPTQAGMHALMPGWWWVSLLAPFSVGLLVKAALPWGFPPMLAQPPCPVACQPHSSLN